DAWLTRRVAGVWSAFEDYCDRRLCVPPAQFLDDWGEISALRPYTNQPPAIAYLPSSSVYLRQYPVVSVDAITVSSVAGNAANVMFDNDTGKIFSVSGPPVVNRYFYDLGAELLGNAVRITYKAGWATMPAALYEALRSVIQPLWDKRAAQ